MPKHLVFDFDGTIAQTMDLIIRLLEEMSEEYGFRKPTPEDIEIFRSQGARELLKTLHISLLKLPFIVKKLLREIEKEIENAEAVPGMREALLELKKEYWDLGILTSNTEINVKKFLRKNDIDIFDYIYSESSVFGKDQKIKHLLLDKGLEKEDVIYIGDEIRDIEACQKIGVKIIAVSWGFNSKEGLGKHNPDYLINKPEELKEVLLKNK